MSDLVLSIPRLPAMSDDAVAMVRRLETNLMALEQVPLPTHHVLHAGTYYRTITIPAGVALTGALIKRATTLIVNGDTTVFIGDETIHLTGYNVLPASAGRKQAFIAHADTQLTMSFATSAKTVEEAEDEFTDEADLLLSRRYREIDTVIITGE